MNFNQIVVITGIGVVSPIGIGVDAFWHSLANGISGVRVRPEFVGTEIPIRIAAQVQGFDPKLFVQPRKAIKIMCNPIQFGCAAAMMACAQAQMSDGRTAPDRIGTLFGTETFYADPSEVADVFRHCTIDEDYQHDRWGEFAMRKIQPLWMLKYLPNMAASHVSIALDARGHSNSICQGEASGLIALIEAATVIQRGACDVVIAGGTGSVAELTSMLYRGNNLSKGFNEFPERASRPFDLLRDGIVAGEGAGALVLESEAHAAARGATPLARISGWSRMFGNWERPDFSTSIANSFRSALADAKMQAIQIGSINAEASGSIAGDFAEAQAIKQVFGETPVVANKGNFGNLGPGTSTIETIAGILSLQHGQLPPTLNRDHPDPACPVRVFDKVTQLNGTDGNAFLKSSISATGQIATVIISSI